MPPNLALLLWFLLLVALLRFDAKLQPNVSAAMWLPVCWIFIVATRLPSQWLDGEVGYSGTSDEGNDLDRNVYLLLIFLALVVLSQRAFSWGKLFASNMLLTVFLAYCLISVVWSDYPFIAFKRWFRDLGVYLALLVAVSDPRVTEGGAVLLRRTLFLTIPLSLAMNKYFPDWAREYDAWTGRGTFIGATTSKNMLGVLCLVGALYFVWDLLRRLRELRDPRTKWIIGIDAALLAMTTMLLVEADSATSTLCVILGCLVIAAAQFGGVQRSPGLLTVSIPVLILSYGVLEFVFGINVLGVVSEAFGRSPDLTGRTNIWDAVLTTNTNPLIGTGYESFWLGERRDYVRHIAGGVNHAHNGYLEVYLNLGWLGLGLVVAFLLASYATICRTFKVSPGDGSFGLALWTILLFYNVTEAALRGHLLWIAFVLFAVSVPRRRGPEDSTQESPDIAVPGQTSTAAVVSDGRR
jgi:exopolysaccharide production protein ExoQ